MCFRKTINPAFQRRAALKLPADFFDHVQRLGDQRRVGLRAHVPQAEDLVGQRAVAAADHQPARAQPAVKFGPATPSGTYAAVTVGAGIAPGAG
jgi:hypothetical protein